MRTRLAPGLTIVLDKGVRIQQLEQTVVACDVIRGVKERPIEVDWQLRLVFIERKEGKWIWIPFEHVAFGQGYIGEHPEPAAAPRRARGAPVAA